MLRDRRARVVARRDHAGHALRGKAVERMVDQRDRAQRREAGRGRAGQRARAWREAEAVEDRLVDHVDAPVGRRRSPGGA